MDSNSEGANNSDCELMSESAVGTNNKVKAKRKQNKLKTRKTSKPPRAPTVTDEPTETPTVSVNKSRKRSPWWDHYIVDEKVPDYAECMYCHAIIGCKSKSGTGPLKNHQLSCGLNPKNIHDRKQKLLDLESKTRVGDDGSIETVTIPRLWEFNQDVIRRALSYMLIVDELPFSFVEREGFRKFCKVINPQFIIPSRTTATRDCYAFFIDERKKLVDIFKKLPSRVCLTTDTWTSGGRVLDCFRTSLTPRMVEALVCTQDWVRDCHEPINVEDILLELEKLEEEGLKDLIGEQPTIIIDETVDELAENIRDWRFTGSE